VFRLFGLPEKGEGFWGQHLTNAHPVSSPRPLHHRALAIPLLATNCVHFCAFSGGLQAERGPCTVETLTDTCRSRPNFPLVHIHMHHSQAQPDRNSPINIPKEYVTPIFLSKATTRARNVHARQGTNSKELEFLQHTSGHPTPFSVRTLLQYYRTFCPWRLVVLLFTVPPISSA
jgi:hypothetical protein